MTTAQEIQLSIKKEKANLKRKFKVKKIGLFGSFASGQFRASSDIDLLVEFSEPIGWEFIDLQEYLGEKLGRKVDLVTMRALKPELKESILKQVIYL